ncbi:alpha/beta hydrolase family protein [Roseivirga sp.]|uniref:alpha/beta hydrolase family protein n=1 Tax=Roseivirga sp. TaxID=1964215 RepID=UPI003B8D6E56
MKHILLICLICFASSSFSIAQNFKEEEVLIDVENGSLGGVVMYPDTKKKTPAVLIIQGSGPTDKDGNSAALPGKNNSLKMLAEALAESGIASLRFDKRGMGMSQSAAIAEADLTFDIFVEDAKTWLKSLLNNKKFTKVGVIGHSQGSLIGMLISRDEDVSAFASLAGPSLNISETIMSQLKANPNNPESIIKEAEDIMSSIRKGEAVENVPSYFASLFRPSIQPFMRAWMKYDPLSTFKKLSIPSIVVNGTTDFQVTMEDANRLYKANPKSKQFIIDGMNHVLKNAPADRQQNLATYGNPDLPLNPDFRMLIKNFFEQNLKK